MTNKTQEFTKEFLKTNLPDIKPGDIVKVHQKIKEGDKERIQVFEGVVLALKHGKGITGTFTVRKIISGIGVEKTYPLHSPNIEKVEIVSRSKIRRSKLYYLRNLTGKKAKLKRKEYVPGAEIVEEKETPQPEPEIKPESTETPKQEAVVEKKETTQPEEKPEDKKSE